MNIHLWIYNHPFYGISDQVEYFTTVIAQHGNKATVGTKPRQDALNVVIENFSAQTRDTLINYCRSQKRRVAVIMTEHIDFKDKEILIHGDPLWSDNDYMHPATQIERLKCLMECLPYIRCFMILGDLPELQNMSQMLPGIDVRPIPFPRIDRVDVNGSAAIQPQNDLLFTGVVTEYRDVLLSAISAEGLSVRCPRKFVSRKKRDAFNRSARIVLNLPQRRSWRWLSLMRSLAALRCGRAAVSLGTMDTSRIAVCTTQIDLEKTDWIATLRDQVSNWDRSYDRAYHDYHEMAAAFEESRPFPHDLFDSWAVTDRI